MKIKNYLLLIFCILFIFSVQLDSVFSLFGLKVFYLSSLIYMFFIKRGLLKCVYTVMFLGFVSDFSLNTAFIGLTPILFLLYLHFFSTKHRFYTTLVVDLIFYYLFLLNLHIFAFYVQPFIYVFLLNIFYRLILFKNR